ncbi:helix-turn-helix domain-containing protein [Weissella soli]|uniref:Excisionase family DNA binding protein n=1 Tax=Weissella soli TaxID=155866 RepID=A0A288Q5E3_9LACO|nr:helix-turn-helix domain-containing protein [Weissella soli]AOT55859.1 hypothetical protein WSWS_00206 [Weissella soli]NKY83671.1 helix-turn-helix domain-containing protein [Weissella soli]RDL06467.1 excisionase family DNA binding protein [Weissella soli]GEN93480.1 hypothetical protein WSO01_10920 [Weissella soli]
MNQNTPHILLTRKEAAELLGISVNSFDRFFRSNPNLRSIMIGSEIRYPYQLLMDFIEASAEHH